MNDQSNLESEAIRSDIDNTRERMDETINAIGNRLDGKHLVDEVLGFFRRSDGAGQMGSKLTHSAEAALNSVTNTVKQNPIPTLLIGAGVAWMIYNSRSHRNETDMYASSTPDYMRESYTESYPEDYTDQPLEQQSGSVASQAREKISGLGAQAREKVSAVGERGREALGAARERAGEIGHNVQQRSREIYGRTREQVVTTAQQHPLEVGIACLAVGLIAGLALPTPERVNRSIGPVVDRLREQTRQRGSEVIEKGKRVAQAAASAAREEAKSQGLTADKLRSEAGAVASRATEAAYSTAQQEGLSPQGGSSSSSGQVPPV